MTSNKKKNQLRTKKKQRTRNTIIREATRLFSESPYDEVKLEEIAEVAFISRKTLYNYFNDKENLFFAVGNQVYKEENTRMADIVDSVVSGKDQVLLLSEKKFKDSVENPILLKIIREFWDRFTQRNVSAEEEYARISQTIGATRLTELVQKPNLLDEFDFELYFEEVNYNELFVQFLINGNMWVKAIQKGKQDGTINVNLPDMQIMQYTQILMDGIIHEKMRRQSALDRINMENSTIENNTRNLLSFFLDA